VSDTTRLMGGTTARLGVNSVGLLAREPSSRLRVCCEWVRMVLGWDAEADKAGEPMVLGRSSQRLGFGNS
jgi:hypothetical protein